MNWKKYEKEILKYFQETFPETEVAFNQKIKGKYSKSVRQIDILIEGEVAGYQIKIVVDCKYFSKNINVKHVESFCSMVEDVEAHQGVLITQKGYSKGAINRAFYGNHKVELDILNFEELKQFQGYSALPYIGKFGLIIQSPFGWVVNIKEKANSLATLHQRGLSLEDAQKKNEWMYINFFKKESSYFDIDKLIELQNKDIKFIDKSAKFDYKNSIKRVDKRKTKIRIADISKYPGLEVTGFIEFDEVIFFIVLLTDRELLNKNLRKLQYLLKIAVPITIESHNQIIIDQCLASIKLTNDNEEKANKYNQIADWYKEMGDYENSFKSLKKALECFPRHYTYLKKIIGEALWQNILDEAQKYSIQLFEIEPTNPAVPQDLIEIYMNRYKSESAIQVFKGLINKNNDNEILGNLTLHLGLLYWNIQEQNLAETYINKAELLFKKAFKSSHQVFKVISEFRKEKNRVLSLLLNG